MHDLRGAAPDGPASPRYHAPPPPRTPAWLHSARPVMKTYVATPLDRERNWLLVDAEGQTLGRLATQIADALRGKRKPTYTPHVDTGDFVVVINAEKISVTGQKREEKMYYRHSGYPGGLKKRSLNDMLERRPEEVIRLAVRGMLPKNRLARKQLTKLKIYAGPGASARGAEAAEAGDHHPMTDEKKTEQGEVDEPVEIAAEDAVGAAEQPTERQQEREQAIVDEPVAESEQRAAEATAPEPGRRASAVVAGRRRRARGGRRVRRGDPARQAGDPRHGPRGRHRPRGRGGPARGRGPLRGRLATPTPPTRTSPSRSPTPRSTSPPARATPPPASARPPSRA